MRKIAIMLICIFTLFPVGQVFAQDAVDGNTPAEEATVNETEPQDSPTGNPEGPEINDGNADVPPENNGDGTTQPDETVPPEVKKILEINEANFPSEYIRNALVGYDYDGDGWLDETEFQVITSLFYDVSSDEGINLSGIEHLTNITSIYLSNTGSSSPIKVKNVELLEKLPMLSSIKLKNVAFDESFKSLNVPNLTDLSVTGEFDLAYFKSLPNLSSLNVEKIKDGNLNRINELPNIEILGITEGHNITSLNITTKNDKLKSLSIEKSSLTNLNGLEKYTALGDLNISGGQIRDISNVLEKAPATINSISISNQSIDSTKRYIVGQPFIDGEITLPADSDTTNTTYYAPMGVVDGKKITWSEKLLTNYSVSYEKNHDSRYISYYATVNNVLPVDYNDGEWIKSYAGNIIKETFIKDKKTVNVFRDFNEVGKDSLFKNRFLINNKEYTYSFDRGSDISSRIYYFEKDTNISKEIHHFTNEIFLKKEAEKYYLKSKSTYNIGGKLIEKEEISYIKDEGIVHDVKYTNLSPEPINNLQLFQMLDTMLNEDDSVPIYADGKGNAYIVSPDFTLYLEMLSEDGVVVSGEYAQGPISDTAKDAKQYTKGALLLNGLDTAIYYGTAIMNLNQNESYSYSYRETLYTEIPEIKANDKVIKVNDNWNPEDMLIGVYNQDGEELDKKDLVITHSADPSKPGVYQITFTYNKIYSKTVTLTVLAEDEKATEKTVVVKKAEAPKTGDATNFYLYAAISILSILTLISVKRFNK